MSDTFANEFEKWLESKADVVNEDEMEGDSNDGSDNGSECAMNAANSDECESDEERLHRYLPQRSGSKLTLGTINDQVPILVDDDNLSPVETQKYKDEPPVLEPISKQSQHCQFSAVKHSQLSPETCIRNYSRNSQVHCKTQQDQNKCVKTYSSKASMEHISSAACDGSNQCQSKLGKRSDSICEQVTSESCGELLPPLIPSPAAVDHQSDLPGSMAKYPNQSPDFCAMEADSTSEITGGKASGVLRTRRLSKTSVHGEVLIECDSTCMLAVSPLIVSPASVSNGEMDEARDSGEGGSKDGEMESKNCDSKKCDTFLDSVADNSALAVTSHKSLVDDSSCECVFKVDCMDKDSILDAVSGAASHLYPQLCDNGSIPACGSFTFGGSIGPDATSIISGSSSDLPVLSAVCPSFTPHHRPRRKRHTIDSPETFSRSRKRACTMPCTEAAVDAAVSDDSVQPSLAHASEAARTGGRRAKTAPQHSHVSCPDCFQDKSPCCRRQRRCHTYPYADSDGSYNGLSEDLHNFVINTTALSDLQSHMHKLLCHLFPHLRSELDVMSPESLHFESILCDLVTSLELPDDQMDAQASLVPASMSCLDVSSTSLYVCQKLVSAVSKFGYTSPDAATRTSVFSSSCDSQAANNFTDHSLKSEAVCSRLSPDVSVLSGNSVRKFKQKRCCRLKGDHYASRDQGGDHIIPKLSQLTLKDMEESLKPSKVLLCKKPGAALDRFVRLSCRALQLLLPDLTISLYSEFSQSVSDLTAFINNVMIMNSRRRSRQLQV